MTGPEEKPSQSVSRLRGVLASAIREPLLHFAIVGVVIFLGVQGWRDAHDVRQIVVTRDMAASISQKYAQQFGAPPAARDLEQLIQAYVQEEALYREGRAQGLDRDDEIVRRRISQKVEFLRQDLAVPAQPTPARLKAWFEAHAAQYASPPRTSFTHLYFSPDLDGDTGAHARAAQALARLSAGAPAEAVTADIFPDLSRYAGLGKVEAARVFGQTEIADRIDAAPVGRWSGPYRSGYGWHLVFVDARDAGRKAAFETVRDQVRADYLDQARREANVKSIEALISRYRVVRQDKEASK